MYCCKSMADNSTRHGNMDATGQYRDINMNRALAFIAVFLLVSCNENTGNQAVTSPLPAAPADSSSATLYTEFNTHNTIRDVMNTLIDPSADALWQAVRFEIDANGPHEEFPETEEEWAALRKHAISIIEGGNALMIPGRLVAAPGSTTDFPEFEYLPEEVAAKLAEDRLSWLGFAQGLQSSAIDILDAIDDRDVERFSISGGLMDEACESCHSQYWYKPENLQ